MMDPLAREARENQRRGQRMEDRKANILHEKTRIIGVDTQALQQQTLERAERERIDLERDMYYDAMGNSYARNQSEMESLRQTQVKEKQVQVNRFRAQQEEDKRRAAMIEARGSESYKHQDTNFLKFRGEDLLMRDRVKAQQAQQMDWLASQVGELQQREQQKQQFDAEYTQLNTDTAMLREMQENQQTANRSALAAENYRYNRQLAVETSAEKQRERMKDEARSQAEVNQTCNGDLLNERVHNSQRDGFRGFTKAQREAVLAEQQRQVAALRAKQAEEASWEKGWQDDSERVRRELVKKDRAKMQAATQRKIQVRKEQELQRAEKQRHYDYLDNVVYTNPVQESYFGQFGQSAR